VVDAGNIPPSRVACGSVALSVIFIRRSLFFVFALCFSAEFCANLFAQKVRVREAAPLSMPGQVDSNSPALWLDGQLNLYNSTGDGPRLSRGADQFSLTGSTASALARLRPWPAWIEAVWQDPSGPILAWYHQERENVCGAQRPAQPHIGAAISFDRGKTFFDQGAILSSPYRPDCQSKNGYFSGGHGDFSVVLDKEGKYFYFLFGNYGGPADLQGVAVARMAYEDRFHPLNSVWKYSDGSWKQPGLGGQVNPVFPATVNWQAPDTDAFWGPSVHWNTYLQSWVMLLNRSCCTPGFPQRGIYISYNADIGNPAGWSKPRKILSDTGWYPQVLGTGPGETDTVAGRVVRLYISGQSRWELIFRRDDMNSESAP
jgi:hypothetical protein